MPSRPPGAVEPAAAAHPATAFEGLLPSYRVPAGHFDELLEGDGALRSHWQGFVRHAGELSAEDLSRKHARVARQIHDNGVTYNVYAAAEGPTRPWALDALPLIIPTTQWEPLAAGLRQRARLLNALAADVYGEQRLIAEGLIPPALVFGHPGFLRPCHGVRPAGGVFLHQVAFDLARGPDGQWWVVGSRTQAPSGAGYALENRLTVSRLFPDAFRDLRVHMLAQFFRGLQDMLLASAPCDGETPHVALLTPGPYNETYFEHAYLARYLGFTLVEGGDLTVRDDRVYLKTLTGLEPVHALLRRLDDDFCDPLELRADSTLGVPGLVQAWRAGTVLVANAFGTSVLESPALLGFMPTACQRMLGQSLAVPSIATWWCGEPAALDDAAPRLAEMVVKPAFPDVRKEPVFLGGSRRGRAGRMGQPPAGVARALRLAVLPPPVPGARLAGRAAREPGPHAARVPRRRRAGRLSRHAGRARRASRAAIATPCPVSAGGAARIPGCSPTPPSRPSRFCPGGSPPRTWRAAIAWCRAAPVKTSSGWGATPNAARTARGSSGPSSPGCPTATRFP